MVIKNKAGKQDNAIPERPLTSSAEDSNNNMSICDRKMKPEERKRKNIMMILYTEESIKASVPPGQRRQNASLTIFTITLVTFMKLHKVRIPNIKIH